MRRSESASKGRRHARASESIPVSKGAKKRHRSPSPSGDSTATRDVRHEPVLGGACSDSTTSTPTTTVTTAECNPSSPGDHQGGANVGGRATAFSSTVARPLVVAERPEDVFWRAARGSDAVGVISCLERWPFLARSTDSATGLTVLFYACKRCDAGLVKALLESGMDVDQRDHAGNTPFLFLLSERCVHPEMQVPIDVVEEILGAGADVWARNTAGDGLETLILRKPGPGGAPFL